MRAYFSRYGTVSLAEVKRTAEGRSRGFGFLAFSQMEDGAQERLFADNPHMLDGRSVDVLPPRPEVRQLGAVLLCASHLCSYIRLALCIGRTAWTAT